MDWRGLAAALGERVFMELDAQQLYADALTGELGRELENGRLLRVLVRLSTVTERPEHESDPQWSETGACSLSSPSAPPYQLLSRGIILRCCPAYLVLFSCAVALRAASVRLPSGLTRGDMPSPEPQSRAPLLTDSRGAGDRYLLKLFRDFVFHQVSEDGAPLLDWGLVAEALTKLDAGPPLPFSPHRCQCNMRTRRLPDRINGPLHDQQYVNRSHLCGQTAGRRKAEACSVPGRTHGSQRFRVKSTTSSCRAAGVPEKVLLLSRDEMSMLVVSYGDVKRCLEAAWSELQSKGSAARAAARINAL